MDRWIDDGDDGDDKIERWVWKEEEKKNWEEAGDLYSQN